MKKLFRKRLMCTTLSVFFTLIVTLLINYWLHPAINVHSSGTWFLVLFMILHTFAVHLILTKRTYRKLAKDKDFCEEYRQKLLLRAKVQHVDAEPVAVGPAPGGLGPRVAVEAVGQPLAGPPHPGDVLPGGDAPLDLVGGRDVPDDPMGEVPDGMGQVLQRDRQGGGPGHQPVPRTAGHRHIVYPLLRPDGAGRGADGEGPGIH